MCCAGPAAIITGDLEHLQLAALADHPSLVFLGSNPKLIIRASVSILEKFEGSRSGREGNRRGRRCADD